MPWPGLDGCNLLQQSYKTPFGTDLNSMSSTYKHQSTNGLFVYASNK
jgi:hypothetical protein